MKFVSLTWACDFDTNSRGDISTLQVSEEYLLPLFNNTENLKRLKERLKPAANNSDEKKPSDQKARTIALSVEATNLAVDHHQLFSDRSRADAPDEDRRLEALDVRCAELWDIVEKNIADIHQDLFHRLSEIHDCGWRKATAGQILTLDAFFAKVPKIPAGETRKVGTIVQESKTSLLEKSGNELKRECEFG